MVLYKLTNGTLADADEVMANFNSGWSIALKNHIRQLIDRTGVYSADETDLWGEAYTAAAGRNNGVDTTATLTTAVFDTDKYVVTVDDEASGDTTHDPDTWTSPENAFDNDSTTSATEVVENATKVLGKTFGAKTVQRAFVDFYYYCGRVGDAGELIVKLQSYNGSTWDDVETLVNLTSTQVAEGRVTQLVDISSSVQGVRLSFNSTSSTGMSAQTIYRLEYGDSAESQITHDIPTGTFSSTISSAIGSFIAADWETGADVDFKLTGTGGAEDTGWLNTNEVSTFTAFTAEPDTLIVKLIPKITSPTAGYPSIKGFAVRAE